MKSFNICFFFLLIPFMTMHMQQSYALSTRQYLDMYAAEQDNVSQAECALLTSDDIATTLEPIYQAINPPPAGKKIPNLSMVDARNSHAREQNQINAFKKVLPSLKKKLPSIDKLSQDLKQAIQENTCALVAALNSIIAMRRIHNLYEQHNVDIDPETVSYQDKEYNASYTFSGYNAAGLDDIKELNTALGDLKKETFRSLRSPGYTKPDLSNNAEHLYVLVKTQAQNLQNKFYKQESPWTQPVKDYIDRATIIIQTFGDLIKQAS